MLDLFVFNALLFLAVSHFGKENSEDPIVLAVIFALLHYVLSNYLRPILMERFDYMPDSHKTTCAAGSVPAGNGLDCKIPSDRFGL
jgi:hypothetical protein